MITEDRRPEARYEQPHDSCLQMIATLRAEIRRLKDALEKAKAT